MAADSTQDKFQALGAPATTADVQSGTPVGSATVPPADQRLIFTPIGGGTPAP